MMCVPLFKSLFIWGLIICGVSQAQRLSIAVSIKPLYGLVAKITKGTEHNLLLFYDGTKSPHTTGLSIGEVVKLKKANLVFWAGKIYEDALSKHTKGLSGAVDLSATPQLVLLKNRTFSEENSCHHHGCGGNHDQHTMDGHYWLDINNAIVLCEAIRDALVEKDPENQTLYDNNTREAIKDLKRLGETLRARIKPTDYLSFHDFSQYFDLYFKTRCVGVITADPHTGTSPKQLMNLLKIIKKNNIKIILKEPQFKSEILKKFEEHGVYGKTVDYLGSNYPPDIEVYERILVGIVCEFLA